MRLEPTFAVPPMPQRLGKYRIERVLGEGAMGIVYKAVDPLIERPVALKTIRKSLLAPHAADVSATGRFRNEAQAAGRLNHPGIVSVYEYGDDEGDAFIAMEYVEGVALLDATARGVRLPLPDVLSMMLQLLDALQHAHAQGVWHRDIKPGNLIVTAEGRLKIADFGIARIDSTHETQKTTVLGSPGYMAPERYTGEPPDARVDIFSCGVLLYELLTGAPPFLGPSNAVMYQVLHVDPPAPSRAPVGEPAPALYDAIVARAIAKRPQDRYESALAMRDALVAAFAEPIAATLSADAVARLQSARTTAGPRSGAAASAPVSAPAAAAAAASASAPAPYCDVEMLRRARDAAAAASRPGGEAGGTAHVARMRRRGGAGGAAGSRLDCGRGAQRLHGARRGVAGNGARQWIEPAAADSGAGCDAAAA